MVFTSGGKARMEVQLFQPVMPSTGLVQTTKSRSAEPLAMSGGLQGWVVCAAVTLTIDRPEARNACDIYHFRDLAKAWRDFAEDADAWVAAFAAYGRGLAELGDEIGVPIVTAEHRQIGHEAERFGVAYKVSGAGGGDLGLACAADAAALAAFTKSIEGRGFRVINVTLAERGLVVEPLVAGALS